MHVWQLQAGSKIDWASTRISHQQQYEREPLCNDTLALIHENLVSGSWKHCDGDDDCDDADGSCSAIYHREVAVVEFYESSRV